MSLTTTIKKQGTVLNQTIQTIKNIIKRILCTTMYYVGKSSSL